jgi:xylulokinase
MGFSVGIDLGTSGVKVLLVGDGGNIVRVASREYPVHRPEVDWVEQDPADWWEATSASINEVTSDVDPREVGAVGLTGQMHGSVFLDADHEVLRPAILWNDQRTSAQCEEILDTIGERRLIELTSNPPFEGFTAPKIMWVMENEPEVFERTEKILLPKDYIRYRLTEEFATDVSDASGTLLLNIEERTWSEEILDALNVPIDMLPEVYESPQVTGAVSGSTCDAVGLPAGTPVVAGAGDNAAGAVGTGIVGDGDAWGSIGTSGVVFVATDDPVTDPDGRAHTFCHAVPGQWHVMGVILSAGGAFSWFSETVGGVEERIGELTGTDSFEILTEEAATVNPGSEGLIFLPYLSGERTPHRDANARGVFFGLSTRHDKPHLVRSVLEGVTYGLRDSLQIVRQMDVDVDELAVSGGGAKSDLWRQIQADVFDADIVTPRVDEGPAYGAALLGGVGAEFFDSVQDACDQAVETVDRVEPNETHRKVYDEYYETYQALYPALETQFAANREAIVEAQRLLESNDDNTSC